MPGGSPADKIEQASFLISDMYESPGSSCVRAELAESQEPNENELLYDAYHPEASISQFDGDLEDLVSDVHLITDQLLLQEATASLSQACCLLAAQSNEPMIEALEEHPPDSSFQKEITPAQSPVGSHQSETSREPSIASTSEPAYDKSISDPSLLARRSHSVTENDDQSSKAELDQTSQKYAEIESQPVWKLEDT